MSRWFRRTGKLGQLHIMSITDPFTMFVVVILMMAIIVAVVLY
jgi:hypothetical protein